MENNFRNMGDDSRAGKLARRRKTNIVLNSLIAIVVLLIIFVSGKIFFGDSQSPAKEGNSSTQVNGNVSAPASSKDSGSGDGSNPNKSDENNVAADDEDSASKDEKEKDKTEEDKKDKEEKKKDREKEKDKKDKEKEGDWKPIGTVQKEHPTAIYDSSSVDWQEMLKAISYATGIDENNFKVQWLGNNGGPNSAVGTIKTLDTGEIYRVSIEWVDKKGWKPVKVEKM
ncbi:YrrS family protein [Bacillus massilinigeriensis]|uniref:YrrS family protein n=1 Tax=Bacillus mediterraneensis TaxID=1805474 RepID=UPI000ACE07FF|nr:YrrS family protein [Bacillus mediterraneensis]